jgi:hypothetical protein
MIGKRKERLRLRLRRTGPLLSFSSSTFALDSYTRNPENFILTFLARFFHLNLNLNLNLVLLVFTSICLSLRSARGWR